MLVDRRWLVVEFAGVAQTGRASAFQAEGRGFEPRRPLMVARVAQSVERFLGKDEVTGSIPVASFTVSANRRLPTD